MLAAGLGGRAGSHFTRARRSSGEMMEGRQTTDCACSADVRNVAVGSTSRDLAAPRRTWLKIVSLGVECGGGGCGGCDP